MKTAPVVLLALVVGAVRLSAEQPSPRPAATGLERLSEDFRALVERTLPSVVQVVATGYAASRLEGGGPVLAREHSTGAGAIVDASGYIVTNAHVVEGAQAIDALIPTRRRPRGSILAPRSRRLPARLVGVDRETDLAVLKVEEEGLPALPFGDSQGLRPGEIVLAFGSPLGLENSVSMGVVSAVARQLKPEDPMIYIQTDASINPGNSGGPLVDTAGRLVGINTLIYTQSGGNEGIGFAAPGHIVRAVLSQIRASGRVRRGGIGARVQTITPGLARGLSLSQEWGVIVADVVPDGPATRAGLRIGDVVLSVDGKIMENARQLEVNIYRKALGETVDLEVLRDRQRRALSVVVTERPEDSDRFGSLVTPERNLVPRLGILGIELDADVVKLLPQIRGVEGVVVAARTGTAAPEGGPLPGDVIYALNGVSVRGLAELRSAAAKLKTGDPVVLQVERKGQLHFLSFEAE